MNTIKQKTTILLAMSALLSLFAYASIAEEVTYPSCAEMGYTTNVDDCISAGGIPLLCPYSNPNDKACICQIRSCRGYPLFKEDADYYYNTLDGGKVIAKPSDGKLEDYIDGEMESCTVGYGNDALIYYRVPQCKEGFMYQNNICDKGCDLNQYPFTTHPGNLAGEVQICKDENGEHYGYTKCNDGWKQNGANCVLNSCDVKEFPYMSNPNEQEYRGEVQSCKIGGNAYYKYKSCDAGFEPKMGVCVSKCEITDCTSTEQSVTSNGTTRTYNEWTCKLNNPQCRIGDTATYDGIDVGTIFHLPDGEDNRVHMMNIGANSSQTVRFRWGIGEARGADVSGIETIGSASGALAVKDIDGKKNTQLMLEFRDSKNWNKGGVDGYPAAEFCSEEYDIGCANGTMCALGEWYYPALGELGYWYNIRYILYNVSGNSLFYETYFFSSSEVSSSHAWALYFVNGALWTNAKDSNSYTIPTLSFIASNY